MRLPKFLSYSAQACFFKDREEYCLRYLVDERIARSPQSEPAAMGSGFDAKEKALLYEKLVGKGDPKYEYEALFETQVEPQCRDFVRANVDHLHESYLKSGMHDELVDLLEHSNEEPRFEFDVTAEINGVPVLGKPDCVFKIGRLWFILDWKVSGYCSKKGISPIKGYRLCKDGWVGNHTKSHGTAHKMYVPDPEQRFGVSTHYMEDSNASWAEQLSLYGWALGLPIGDENVVLMIDNLACRPVRETKPAVRVANYRSRVRDSFQEYFAGRLKYCWETINKGPRFIFEDQGMNEEQSEERFYQLNDSAKEMAATLPEAAHFNEITRAEYRG